MVILPDHKMAFIHIPRTSGTALSSALCTVFANAEWINTIDGQHTTAKRLARKYPGYSTFAIMRNPIDIFRSHYGWCLRYHESPPKGPPWFVEAIHKAASRTINAHIKHCLANQLICNHQGFFDSYCVADTTVYRYEDDPYAGISKLLGVNLDVQRENETRHILPDLADDVVSAIATRCAADFERFGYDVPDKISQAN